MGRDKEQEFKDAYGFVDIETTSVTSAPMFTTKRGTVTGRLSSTEPNFKELEPENVKFAEVPESLVNADLSEIEARVASYFALKKYSSGPRKLGDAQPIDTAQLEKQMRAASEQMHEWHLKMIADGYTCCSDEYWKEE